jgi:hypothetical protein
MRYGLGRSSQTCYTSGTGDDVRGMTGTRVSSPREGVVCGSETALPGGNPTG